MIFLVTFSNSLSVSQITPSKFDATVFNKNLRAFNDFCEKNKMKLRWSKPLSTLESPLSVEEAIYNEDDPLSKYETIVYSYVNPSNTGKQHDSFNYKSSILILSSISDASLYGNQTARSFQDFLLVLSRINYSKAYTNLAFLVKTEEEYNQVASEVQRYYTTTNQEFFDGLISGNEKFAKITLVHAPFIERTSRIDRSTRHEDNIQKKRRSIIAKVRNFLVNTALSNEKYTLFVDSDIIDIPSNLVNYFIKSGKDIIVPRIQKGKDCFDYDQNSWVGERSKPSPSELQRLNLNKQIKLKQLKESFLSQENTEDLEELKYELEVEIDTLEEVAKTTETTVPFLDKEEQFVYVPKREKNSKLLLDLSRRIEVNSKKAFHYFTPIDSVGGAVLFVKSIIFKQGVQFPPLYIVGTDWKRVEGYDGIETEGLCYQAKILGYQCWAAPDVLAQHYDL